MLVSDPALEVIDRYHLRNADVPDLALHAVYIIEADGTIAYRKIARRRVKSKELLYALDGKDLRCCPGSCNETICNFAELDHPHPP